MSGLGMSFDKIKIVALKGLRKSRTLQAVHMSGMSLTETEQIELREILRVNTVESQQAISDERIDGRMGIANVEMDLVKEVFHNESSKDNEDFLGKRNKRTKENLKLQVKDAIRTPILIDNEKDKLVFQRNLGNLEMP